MDDPRQGMPRLPNRLSGRRIRSRQRTLRKNTAINFHPLFRMRLLPARLTVGIVPETSSACRSGLMLCESEGVSAGS